MKLDKKIIEQKNNRLYIFTERNRQRKLRLLIRKLIRRQKNRVGHPKKQPTLPLR